MAFELNGILPVDKPSALTSHDVVAQLRRLTGIRRIGHTGTLDPMATGLMLVCLGPATRVAQFLTGLDKTYLGAITFGAISSTYDAEGSIVPQQRPLPADPDTVMEAMRHQLGQLTQLAPPYSAVKVRGKKLYEYAREGEEVPQKPRNVTVYSFEMTDWDPPRVEFEARVSSGTYIRSMAHELGIELGCGGYLSALRRTRVGSFEIGMAAPLEHLAREPGLIPHRVMSVTEALGHLPKVTLLPDAELAHLNGRAFTTRDIAECDGLLSPGRPVLVLDDHGRALSVVQPELVPGREDAPADELSDVELVLGASPMIFRPLRVLAQR